jgi:FtsP/CotA-like multicopper oxidase with cupredoxin domain
MRYLDVTMMPDMTSATMFTNVDPTNQPAVVTNALINFGWEYVWHCHLLGHEENDMMRPMILAVSPNAPAQFAAVADKGSVTLTWTNNANNQTGFTVQRASSASGPWSNIASVTGVVGVGGSVSYVDRSVTSGTTYYYRVMANNVVGYTMSYALPAVGYPHVSADSAPTSVVSAKP